VRNAQRRTRFHEPFLVFVNDVIAILRPDFIDRFPQALAPDDFDDVSPSDTQVDRYAINAPMLTPKHSNELRATR
jgi:hypothetical protein